MSAEIVRAPGPDGRLFVRQASGWARPVPDMETARAEKARLDAEAREPWWFTALAWVGVVAVLLLAVVLFVSLLAAYGGAR